MLQLHWHHSWATEMRPSFFLGWVSTWAVQKGVEMMGPSWVNAPNKPSKEFQEFAKSFWKIWDGIFWVGKVLNGFGLLVAVRYRLRPHSLSWVWKIPCPTFPVMSAKSIHYKKALSPQFFSPSTNHNITTRAIPCFLVCKRFPQVLFFKHTALTHLATQMFHT